MAKCSNCGKSGLFLKLENGLCNDCVTVARLRREIATLTKQKEGLQREIALYQNRLYNLIHSNDPTPAATTSFPAPAPSPIHTPTQTPAPVQIPKPAPVPSSFQSSAPAKPSFLSNPGFDSSAQFSSINLDAVPDRGTARQPVMNGCAELYAYTKVPVSDIDHHVLQNMVVNKSFVLIPELCADGSISLLHNGTYVAKLSERVEICADWLRRKDPIRCEMTGFQSGKEHIVLAFYRDEAARLSYRESAIVKLTSYTAEYKQESIAPLKSGEKLTCSEDDESDGKVNVLDWCEDPIGRLPKKYADKFLDEDFAGIFFDHADEDAEGRLVPYVKIYL